MPSFSRIVSVVNPHKVISVASNQPGTFTDPTMLTSDIWDGTTRQLFRFEPHGEYYRIVCLASRLVLDVVGQQQADGTHVQVYPDTGNDNQRWHLDPSPDGKGTVIKSKMDGRLLTVRPDQAIEWIETFGLQAGQPLPFLHASLADQVWSIEPLTQGPFKIVGVNGLVVDVPSGQVTDGLQVQQFHDHNGDNQQWHVLPFLGKFKVISQATGMVLQVPEGGPQANAPVQQGFDISGANQLWSLIPETFGGLPGYVKIASAMNTNFVLEVPDGSTDDRVLLQVFNDNGGGNQRWQFVNIPSR